MNADPHERAKRLNTQSRVEGIAPSEQQWLDVHLEGCARCTEFAQSTERALRSLRSVSVTVSPGLVRATRHRVEARVQELGEHRSQMVLLWVSCAFSWVLGIASAPWVWRVFAWVGHRAGLPALIWQLGFALWWAVPAAAAITVALVRKANEATDG